MKAVSFTGKRTGKTLHKFEIDEFEYLEFEKEYSGFCIYCGEIAHGDTEPDAEKYKCEYCELNGVYGVPQLLIMGFISIVDDAR